MKYKAITKPIFALIGLVMFAFTAQAQDTPPSGTPYITLTVTKDSIVQIAMQAAAPNTPVWVEAAAGNYTQVAVGTNWTGFVSNAASDATIKVYGNLKGFDCDGNTTKITGLTFSSELTNLAELYCHNNSLAALDISGLTNLKTLSCYSNSLTVLDVSGLTNLTILSCFNNFLTSLNVSGLVKLTRLYCHNNSLTTLDVSGLTKLNEMSCYNNNFSTQAIDDIYCGLPQRQSSDNAAIYPIYSSSSADTAIVLATSTQNATDKNWKVQYLKGFIDIPASGNYVCSTPYVGTPYITLTVTKDSTVQIYMRAAAEGTPVWVETAAGNYTQVTIDTNWVGPVSYTASDTTIKVHGNLKGFYCDGNTTKITGLTFSSGLMNLEKLSCNDNSLTALDVSGLTNLTRLDCYSNSLTVLDVSGLTNLKTLSCFANSLMTLDVSGLTDLTTLYCFDNSLTALDVSGLANLKTLSCFTNSLASLDVSGLTNLKTLYCYDNSFSTQAIDDIYCGLPERIDTDGAVIYPIENSNSADTTIVLATNKWNAINKNWKVQYVNDTDIPDTQGSYVCGSTPPIGIPYITLTVTKDSTVQVDMMAAAAGTTVWIEKSQGIYDTVTVDTDWIDFVNYTATDTTIKVYGNLKGFDCSGNGTKLTGLTFSSGLTNLEELYCFNNFLTALDISRLTKLEGLWCFNNSLKTLNASGLTKLTTLDCHNNSLTSLNVSGLTNLEKLYGHNNSLKSLNVSGLTSMDELDCHNNSLTSLNVSGLTKLERLYCYENTLTSLDVSGLTNLERLYCYENTLTSINVSELTNLLYLWCDNNSLASLDVSGLTNLQSLWCSNNSLTSLDVSGLASLQYLYCFGNSLTALNVSGLTNLTHLHCYNNNFSTQAIDYIYCGLPLRDIADNAVIYPVYADTSANYATVLATNKQNAINKNWKVQDVTHTDVPATGSYVCGTPYAGTPYITFTVTKDSTVQINIQAAAEVTPIWIETTADNYTQVTIGTDWTDYVNYTATDTTIKVHGHLEGFDCSGNGTKLTGLTFSSGLTNLKSLDCSNNFLTTLDVSGLTNLEMLGCNSNSLTTLDISGLTNLKSLDCSNNFLTTLDVSGLTNLEMLGCNSNSLTSLNVSGLTKLQNLDCSNNSLTSLDVSGLMSLWYLFCRNDSLSSLDVSGLTSLRYLFCDNNFLTVLDVSGLTKLNGLACDNNFLTVFDVSELENLKILSCRNNSITSLDVSGLTKLNSLACDNNSLTSLDVSGLTNLKWLYCYDNNFSTQAIDDIYCGLPERTADSNGVIQPIYDSNSADTTIVLATNKQNALSKNWAVKYANDTDIPDTQGSYVCGTGIDNITATQHISIYPNPAKDIVTVKLYQSHIGMLYITDMSGKVVLSKQMDNAIASVDINTLAQGVYYVKAGSKVEKLIVK